MLQRLLSILGLSKQLSIILPCEEAIFSAADIEYILQLKFPTLSLVGVIFVPVIENGEQTLELRGVYFNLLTGNMIQYGFEHGKPIFRRPANKQNYLNVNTKITKTLEEFHLVFFHMSTLAYLGFWQRGKYQAIHVSRVIVDYKNGDVYQNLKMRPEPNPLAQLSAKQISSVSAAIGVSCPPDWIPGQKAEGYAGTFNYINKKGELDKFDITKQMLIDLVDGPIDQIGPGPLDSTISNG